MLFQKETWLESNGLKYKKNHGAIILLLNYLAVSRFERRGFILHTQKKVVALPYVTSYAKNGSKLQWFPPCPRHVDSIKIHIRKSCLGDECIAIQIVHASRLQSRH